MKGWNYTSIPPPLCLSGVLLGEISRVAVSMNYTYLHIFKDLGHVRRRCIDVFGGLLFQHIPKWLHLNMRAHVSLLRLKMFWNV
jgi:hypothetical protein